jgi:hypothetical protein
MLENPNGTAEYFAEYPTLDVPWRWRVMGGVRYVRYALRARWPLRRLVRGAGAPLLIALVFPLGVCASLLDR